MNESSQSSSIGSQGSQSHRKISPTLKAQLENALEKLTLKSIILILAEIALERHQKQSYLEWDKDAQLMAFLSSYIEN